METATFITKLFVVFKKFLAFLNFYSNSRQPFNILVPGAHVISFRQNISRKLLHLV